MKLLFFLTFFNSSQCRKNNLTCPIYCGTLGRKSLMKYVFSVCLIVLFNINNKAQVINSINLEFNNVKARLFDEGGFFSNTSAFTAGYEVPKGSNLSTIFGGSYWIGAEDQFGNLHVSGTKYSWGSSTSAFHSGPLAESIAYGSVAYSNLYQNALWKVSKAEIMNHINNYQSSGYVVPTAIANWPGNGEISLGVASQLAPFIDLNNNGIYEPSQGDYPDIRGDEAVYIIMNDESFIPDGNQLGIELHAMFYQFAAGNYLNNTTFLNLKAINRSNMPYTNYHQALFIDFDIGNYSDDYAGCYPPNNVLFGYNGDDNDETNGGQLGYGTNPPCQGVVALSHNLSNAGAIFSNMDSGVELDTLMWLLMNSKYGDSTQWIDPLTNAPTNFIMSGNPNDINSWNEASSNNPMGDRRGMLTIKENSLPAGGSICSDYAFIYDRSSTRLANVQNVINIADMLRNAYQSSNTFPCQSSAFNLVNDINEEVTFVLYPNPSTGDFIIDTKQHEAFEIMVYDALGQVVFQDHFQDQQAKISLQQNKGIYLVAIKTNSGLTMQKLLIQ